MVSDQVRIFLTSTNIFDKHEYFSRIFITGAKRDKYCCCWPTWGARGDGEPFATDVGRNCSRFIYIFSTGFVNNIVKNDLT